MVYRTHPQGSLVERELSAKLTEGLRREISRICPTFGEFAILSRAILPALRATSLYTREASSGCGGKDEPPCDIVMCACGRGDPISRLCRQLPQRGSQGAAARGSSNEGTIGIRGAMRASRPTHGPTLGEKLPIVRRGRCPYRPRCTRRYPVLCPCWVDKRKVSEAMLWDIPVKFL